MLASATWTRDRSVWLKALLAPGLLDTILYPEVFASHILGFPSQLLSGEAQAGTIWPGWALLSHL